MRKTGKNHTTTKKTWSKPSVEETEFQDSVITVKGKWKVDKELSDECAWVVARAFDAYATQQKEIDLLKQINSNLRAQVAVLEKLVLMLKEPVTDKPRNMKKTCK